MGPGQVSVFVVAQELSVVVNQLSLTGLVAGDVDDGHFGILVPVIDEPGAGACVFYNPCSGRPKTQWVPRVYRSCVVSGVRSFGGLEEFLADSDE